MNNIVNTNNLQYIFNLYISECQYTKCLRSETLKSYREVFATFQKIMPEISSLEDITPNIFNIFFKRLSNRKRIVGVNQIKTGVKASTIRTYYNKLIAFVRWLENNGYLKQYSVSSKVVKPVSPVYDDYKILSEGEMGKIITAIITHSNNYLHLRRDLLILGLFVYTGIRKGELLSLRIQDIDLQKRILHINGRTSKSKKSRFIPIHFNLEGYLKDYLQERKSLCFTSEFLIISTKEDKGLSTHGLKSWVTKYNRLSGVKFHMHQFRHTFACTMARNNADFVSIMRVLGHSSYKMTERYLRSIRSEDSRKYIDLISL